jgi:phosphatidylserine synthase
MTASMLRLARFEVESTDANNWFHGLSTPMSALMLITTCGVIWLQPETIWGPGIVEWDWGSGEHPYFDFMILPVAFLCGCLMISDRKLPKGRSGLLLRLSALALLCLLSAIIIQVGWGLDADGSPSISSSNASLILLSGALLLVSSYILFGPRIVAATATTGDNEVDEVETAVGTLMDAAEVIVTSLRGEDVESEAESKEQ